MLKRTFVTAAAAATLFWSCLAAQAGDLSIQRPTSAPAYAPVPLFDWSGLYFGLNGGGGWGSSSHTDSNFGIATGNFGISGGVIGGTPGFHYQTRSRGRGLEGEIDL